MKNSNSERGEACSDLKKSDANVRKAIDIAEKQMALIKIMRETYGDDQEVFTKWRYKMIYNTTIDALDKQLESK